MLSDQGVDARLVFGRHQWVFVQALLIQRPFHGMDTERRRRGEFTLPVTPREGLDLAVHLGADLTWLIFGVLV